MPLWAFVVCRMKGHANMTERQRELLEKAKALEFELYRTLLETLPPPQVEMLLTYESLHLYRGMLEGALRTGPAFDAAEIWASLGEEALSARMQLKRLAKAAA